MWIFYGMGAISLFVLRAKHVNHERPFRVPGYPVVPAIFVLASVAMTVLSIQADPKTTLMWIGVLLAGVPVYYVWEWLFPAATA
jgi:APA family basic amino acid/polyamine antiporter